MKSALHLIKSGEVSRCWGRCGENMLMWRVSLCVAGEKLTDSHSTVCYWVNVSTHRHIVSAMLENFRAQFIYLKKLSYLLRV